MCEAGAHRRAVAQEQVRLGTFKKVGPQERRSAPRLARTRRRGRSSGQSLVEFALVAPLFLFLLFGILEFSLINASIGTFNFAAKDAARYGAIVGNGSAPGGVGVDQYIVNNVILPRVNGVVFAQMSQVEIFNSTENGACVSDKVNPCEHDVWTKSGGAWASTGNLWPSTQRLDSLANADYLGVRISYTYTYLTAFFAVTSPTVNLTALSIQRIEPQEYGHRPVAPTVVSVQPTVPTLASLLDLTRELTNVDWTRHTALMARGGRG